MDMSSFHLLDPEDNSNQDLQQQAQLAALQQLPSTNSSSGGDTSANANAAPTPMAMPAPDVATALQNLSSQYGPAQDQAAKNQLVTNLLHSVAGGIGQALGARPDEALWKDIDAQAQAPLTNVQNQVARLKSNLDLQKEMNSLAPNKGVGSIIKSLVAGLKGADGKPLPQEQQDAIVQQLSASPPDQQLKVLTEMVKNNDASARLAESHGFHQMMGGLREKGLDIQQTRADSQASQKQGQAYSELRKNLETFRGNKSAQQAAADVYSANKALGIVANKDPNTLTNQDLALLNEELAKIATGGVPGEHGVTALMPNNLQTKYAEFKNFLSSNPTPANAGQYIQHNLSYLKEMVGAAQGVLGDYRRNIVQGYKGRITPDQLEEVRSDYNLSNSPSPSTSAGSSMKQPPNGLMQVQQNGHLYNWNPQSGKYE